MAIVIWISITSSPSRLPRSHAQHGCRLRDGSRVRPPPIPCPAAALRARRPPSIPRVAGHLDNLDRISWSGSSSPPSSSIGLLASVATVEGRLVPSVFEDDQPSKRFGNRVQIGLDLFHQACGLVHFKNMCQSLTMLVTPPRQVLLASMHVAAAKAMEAKAPVDEYVARTHATGRW
nr:unnamed protein product [Digitaria exilis]